MRCLILSLQNFSTNIYLDGGWEKCRKTIRVLFADRVAAVENLQEKDAKTRLQELLQSRGLALPHYDLLATSGNDHAKQFEVRCEVPVLTSYAVGSGNSRRAAEQEAAKNVLAHIQALLK